MLFFLLRAFLLIFLPPTIQSFLISLLPPIQRKSQPRTVEASSTDSENYKASHEQRLI
uniref:Uncharacterized protein n=1 Tax=Nelumbo nucifera TaxID=4432 RepID=A0A822XX63_NELNU|nr:TPA_asm: hypothetical protein HUJ06_023451 [Nelumbo nucifera]